MRIKRGDTVVVISGKDRNKNGKVTKVLPRQNLLVVEGVNILKKHRRARRGKEKGQIVTISHPVHISNVMLADPSDGRPTKVAYRFEDGRKIRVAKKSNTVI